MKLIDADKLLQKVKDHFPPFGFLSEYCFESLINEQPEVHPLEAISEYFNTHKPISIDICRFPQKDNGVIKVHWASDGFEPFLKEAKPIPPTENRPYREFTTTTKYPHATVVNFCLVTEEEKDILMKKKEALYATETA